MAMDTPWASAAGLTSPILDLASLSTAPARRRIFSLLPSLASYPSLQKLSPLSNLAPCYPRWPASGLRCPHLAAPPPSREHPFRLVNLRSNDNAPPPPPSARRSSVTRPNS